MYSLALAGEFTDLFTFFTNNKSYFNTFILKSKLKPDVYFFGVIPLFLFHFQSDP